MFFSVLRLRHNGWWKLVGDWLYLPPICIRNGPQGQNFDTFENFLYELNRRLNGNYSENDLQVSLKSFIMFNSKLTSTKMPKGIKFVCSTRKRNFTIFKLRFQSDWSQFRNWKIKIKLKFKAWSYCFMCRCDQRGSFGHYPSNLLRNLSRDGRWARS